jgi:anti-anti-sigma factor
MTLDVRTSVENNVATLRLSGDVDAASAPELNEIMTSVTGLPLQRLELDLTEVGYLSSAGLRCLVFAHQRLGRGVEIVLIGAGVEVAETIRITGFDRSVTLRGPVGA